jgi:PTS system nitrogen regulatory IIA component
MKNLSVRIDPSAILDQSSARSKQGVFAILANKAAEVYGLNAQSVIERLEKREGLGTTGFGGAIAIPHAKIHGLNECLGVFLRLNKPVEFDAYDAKPVDLIFALLSPEQGGVQHLKALAEISRLLRDENIVTKLRGANGADALYVLLAGQREQQAA